ncbi:hypothetical protein O181_116162 [Austropuccinia psidii MF-1]|uniref:Uncharacterized protein n=1 Tax=Austropuccinia psidii MF-1 TaxID=1389203 RepID=A0A9Q3K8V0_9BASI|nr:hypothetical protein [Austropuccinia psidii MF-1]
MIQTLEDIIRRFCAYGLEFQDSDGFTHDWCTLILSLELAYKTSVHSSTGPFVIVSLHGTNAVQVKLSGELENKHPTLPVSLIKPYQPTDKELFPLRNPTPLTVPPVEQDVEKKIKKVMSQPQVMTLLHGCCGNLAWDQVGANWPHHIFYGQLDPFGLLWPFGHTTFPWRFMASGHILPSLAFLANSHIPNPQASIFFLGLGVSFVLLGGSGPPSHNHHPVTIPFH